MPTENKDHATAATYFVYTLANYTAASKRVFPSGFALDGLKDFLNEGIIRERNVLGTLCI